MTIYDLRDPSCPNHPHPTPTGPPGVQVRLESVVVTSLFEHHLTVADPRGGTFSGIWVYNKDGQVDVSQLEIGTVVNLEGGYLEFYHLSEINLSAVEVVGQGDPPEPLLVEDPAALATGDDGAGPLVEPLEGMLVRIEDVWVNTTKPDCPQDFGEFLITGGLRVDDLAELDYEPRPGDYIRSITGVLNYGFGNSKLEPRVQEDLDVVGCGHRPDKCPEIECIAESGADETGALVITEIQYDPRGIDADGEWFEVYNAGREPVDIRGWKIADCGDNHHVVSSNVPVVVDPGAYAVIGSNPNRASNGGVTVLYAWGDDFWLSNEDGSILLYDAQGQLVDQVRYSSGDPWPDGEIGQTLMLDDPSSPNEGPEHWSRSQEDYGGGNKGTPGRANR